MKIRQINKGCIEEKRTTKSLLLVLNTSLDRQPVNSSEDRRNVIFMSFEHKSYLASIEKLETLPAGTKPRTSHHSSPGGERRGKRKR